jgi:hypothetical protein
MKKLSKKSLLLFTGVMAVCAFAMPAMSSAASWGVIGTEHTLHSANLGFTATDPVLGGISSSCAASTFTVDVRTAAALTVTSTQFTNCTAQGAAIGDCTVTATGTPEPNPDWTVTGVTTTNVQIHDVRIDLTFENKPGSSNCLNVNGQNLLLTGTLTGGVWDAAAHQVTFNNAEGLVSHGATGNNTRITVTGTIRDTQQTLTLS